VVNQSGFDRVYAMIDVTAKMLVAKVLGDAVFFYYLYLIHRFSQGTDEGGKRNQKSSAGLYS